MYNSMKKLIEKKFYKTKEDVQTKLDVFFSFERLSVEEYTELTELVNELY